MVLKEKRSNRTADGPSTMHWSFGEAMTLVDLLRTNFQSAPHVNNFINFNE